MVPVHYYRHSPNETTSMNIDYLVRPIFDSGGFILNQNVLVVVTSSPITTYECTSRPAAEIQDIAWAGDSHLSTTNTLSAEVTIATKIPIGSERLESPFSSSA